MGRPWEKWIPGVLNKEQMSQLCDEGLITGDESLLEQIHESAIDLSLSNTAYRMIHGSVKPSASHSYEWFIKQNRLAEAATQNGDGTFTLAAKETYVFKLNERLNATALKEFGFHGQATAKSSIGRVDVLARLIVDGMDTYECFDPVRLGQHTGDLYIEITPITFNVKVKRGICLSQLRLFYGKPKDAEISCSELFRTVLQGPGAKDGSLTVDLTNDTIGGLPLAAFRTVGALCKNAIQLWKEPEEDAKPKPWKYWTFEATNDDLRLEIKETQFYLLRSKERIAVPEGIAIYCRASDETIGEMRIHYAGFVHPTFGTLRSDGKWGTPLMFEVRGHQVNVSLADGEKLANLTFYRMSQNHKPVQSDDHSYENQTLQLSNVFGSWPEKLRRNEDDTLEPQ